jgi:16S rRNA (guanine(966)-N(2))-methyltransferase RsmD
LRVISGLKKGYRLKGPKSGDIRPTEDRIKESMFNILGYIDHESIVLDLCAGTGSIGIEFLSRGAKKAYFVDSSRESIQCIKENLDHTKLVDRAEVIKGDVIKAIINFGQRGITFDYIFADPPYNRVELIGDIVNQISINGILNKDKGIFIIEHEKRITLDDIMYDLKRIDYRVYKNTCLSFYSFAES